MLVVHQLLPHQAEKRDCTAPKKSRPGWERAPAPGGKVVGAFCMVVGTEVHPGKSLFHATKHECLYESSSIIKCSCMSLWIDLRVEWHLGFQDTTQVPAVCRCTGGWAG